MRHKVAAFCREYPLDLNGAAAARRAGYSPRSADRTAQRLLDAPVVQREIKRILDERSASTGITAETVLRQIQAIAGFDVSSMLDSEGRLLPVPQWPAEAGRIIAGLEIEQCRSRGVSPRLTGDVVEETGQVKKIRLPDRLKALELLGRHLKLFTDVLEHRGLEGLAERLQDARKRTRQ